MEPASRAASMLTILSMAALGLGVDIRVVAKAGPRLTAVVTLSLVSLGAIALMPSGSAEFHLCANSISNMAVWTFLFGLVPRG